MKKLIGIILIITATFTLQAQKLKGTQEYSEPLEFGGSRYTTVNWNVNCQIILKEDAFYIRLSNPIISVSPTSLYGTPNGGKLYSKMDLGLSTWPDSDPTPYNMSLELTLIYPDGTYHKTSAVIREDNFIERISQFNGLKNASPGSFKVASVEYMGYNGGADNKLDILIAAKKNGSSNSSNSSNNPATQNKTTTDMPENTSGNDPLAHFETDGKTYTNPMSKNTNSGSSSVDNFNKDYAQGQQIVDAVTPLATGIVDAWNRKIDRENAALEDQRAEDARRKVNYANFCSETNKIIFDWKYYEKNVIQRFPLLFESNSPSWASILGTDKFSSAFGKDVHFIMDKFRPIGYSKNIILKNLEAGKIYPLEITRSFYDFYAVELNINYKYDYVMNNVKLDHYHAIQFIYNENNMVIGILIDIATSNGIQDIPIEKYYKDIISKIGTNYVMLDAKTFLLKDKLIFFEYEQIQMFDLNYMVNQLRLDITEVLKMNPSVNLASMFNATGLKFNETFNMDKNRIKYKTTSSSALKTFNDIAYYTSNITNNQLIVEEIDKGSPSEKAGLMKGDIIKAVNNLSTPNILFFRLTNFAYRSSGNMKITYLREGKEYETYINLKK